MSNTEITQLPPLTLHVLKRPASDGRRLNLMPNANTYAKDDRGRLFVKRQTEDGDSYGYEDYSLSHAPKGVLDWPVVSTVEVESRPSDWKPARRYNGRR